jgi:hypothetical protein
MPCKLMKLLWETAPESLRIKETIESDERARSRAAKLVDFFHCTTWATKRLPSWIGRLTSLSESERVSPRFIDHKAKGLQVQSVHE